MNGIDTSAAALLASRIGALGAAGSQGSTGAAQAGVSALTGGAAALADPRNAGSPQASAQTVLSAVALALDAIIRSGGEATPSVVGRAPIWTDPAAAGQAMAGDAGSLPLPGLANPTAQTGATDRVQAQAQAQALEAALLADLEASTAEAAQAGLPGSAQDAGGAAGAGSANGAADAAENGGKSSGMTGGTSDAASSTQGAQAAQRTALATQTGPVAVLAATLAQTVASSGLFYESHLAQWLRGQRTPGELADEPQNRLTSGSAQLPLEFAGDRSLAADDIADVLWIDLPSAAQQGARAGGTANAAGAAAASGARGEANAAALAEEGERAGVNTAALADALLPATRTPAGAGAGVGVHEALLPLVRQQLDLLATGEFRWTGEAWPGVRLDWTIQPDDDDERHTWQDARAGRVADENETPWHTRLTLALPALGTVDAELALTGSTLAVRVQASPGGAQRLSAHSEALRGRLEALGLALAGLSIREIGGAGGMNGMGGAAGMDGMRAAGAYARAAEATHAADTPHAIDSTDWELR
ncbi:flagellar hook-length control protein FliK [Paraburkholderia sacchari]|uniref:Flagellar hook-length control protein FliK n=1 Tax=Paraburkholderia sacchari TaxID=159450 RepID=A0A8T6Z9K8_9BURK|nr:flagellar hook-length control protein FliK [Paraburkholderia sacchari]NLP60934.1 flagellar hook-length control protein FliK [Paraburkholderia sacchari]